MFLVFYFNTEPRLKWNKIVLAAKTFHFISDVVPFWNKIILKNFVPQPPPLLTYAKRFLFYFRRGSMLK